MVNRAVVVCLACVAVVLVASFGCSTPSADGDVARSQWYHAYLATDLGDQIPFFVQVPADCEHAPAVIVNGNESLEADCRQSPVGFVVDFPVYATQIEAWYKPDGSLTGHWCREEAGGREPMLTMKAVPVAGPDAEHRFDAPEPAVEAPVPPDGSWRVEFESYGSAKAVLETSGNTTVTASIEIPSQYGDLRYLAGNIRGSRLRLSTFDGQHAYLLDAEILPDGNMAGRWIRPTSLQTFVAELDPEFEVPSPLGRIAFSGGDSFPIEALEADRFDGKAVIVEVFGTWCPNCNDITPILVELYDAHRDDGLEILGLAFEFGYDDAYKLRRIEAFRARHGIHWEIELADTSLEAVATDGLYGLAPLEGVPVTIFLNRDRTVRAVYAGISGPATGDAYDTARDELFRLTAEILD